MDQQMYLIAGVPSQEGILIDELRMEARIIKDDSESMNRATVTLYNAGPETLRTAIGDQTSLMQIFYGLGDSPPDASLGYIGDITSMLPDPGEVDDKYILECGEKKNTLAKARTNVSFSKSVSVGQLLDLIGKDLGLSDARRQQFIDQLPKKIKNLKAVTRRVQGRSRDVLSGLAKAHSFDWMYVDGRLVILEKDAPLEMPAIVLKPETGLIGTPTYTQTGKRKGWRIKATAQTGLVPRRLVQVESSSITGLLMLRRNETAVSNWGPPFEADLFAQEI